MFTLQRMYVAVVGLSLLTDYATLRGRGDIVRFSCMMCGNLLYLRIWACVFVESALCRVDQ